MKIFWTNNNLNLKKKKQRSLHWLWSELCWNVLSTPFHILHGGQLSLSYLHLLQRNTEAQCLSSLRSVSAVFDLRHWLLEGTVEAVSSQDMLDLRCVAPKQTDSLRLLISLESHKSYTTHTQQGSGLAMSAVHFFTSCVVCFFIYILWALCQQISVISTN